MVGDGKGAGVVEYQGVVAIGEEKDCWGDAAVVVRTAGEVEDPVSVDEAGGGGCVLVNSAQAERLMDAIKIKDKSTYFFLI
jgi:hypothetical protein